MPNDNDQMQLPLSVEKQRSTDLGSNQERKIVKRESSIFSFERARRDKQEREDAVHFDRIVQLISHLK